MLETCPQCNQLSLIKEPLGREFNMSTDGFYHTTILDAELNPVKCYFLGSVFVEIDTKDIAGFRLSIENLKELILLIKQVDKKYKKDYKKHLIN